MKKHQLIINDNLLNAVLKEGTPVLEDMSALDCIYAIFNDIKIEGNDMSIGGQTITGSYFSTIPKEILGDVAVYLITAGDGDEAYKDAVKELLRMELQEDYLLSGSIIPGQEGMDISQAPKFAKLLEIEGELPENSMVGMFFFFNEEHPMNFNSCETCMARGHGCDLSGTGSCSIHNK